MRSLAEWDEIAEIRGKEYGQLVETNGLYDRATQNAYSRWQYALRRIRELEQSKLHPPVRPAIVQRTCEICGEWKREVLFEYHVTIHSDRKARPRSVYLGPMCNECAVRLGLTTRDPVPSLPR